MDTTRHSHKVMELLSRPISRPKTKKVEEHQHPLMSEEDSEEDIDSLSPTYPSSNPKSARTPSPADKARELLNFKLFRQENQQLSAHDHLPHCPQTTLSGSDMTLAQSPAHFRTVSCRSCITHSNRLVVQNHHHPLALEKDLDLIRRWPSTHPNYLSTVVRATSPPSSEEDHAELALHRLAREKLRKKLREELPGSGSGGREELKAVVKPYVPCEFHTKHPPSYWIPDLKALGLQFNHSQGSCHGGISECCDWRRFRASVPKDELEKKAQKLEAGDGELGEKQEMKESGEYAFTEKIAAEMKQDADEEVTYFTFITHVYFAEASWPEILASNRLRKRWYVFGEPPFSIERVVGGRVGRTYTREEIEAGCVETEEAFWWEMKEGREEDKEEWNKKKDRMAGTDGE